MQSFHERNLVGLIWRERALIVSLALHGLQSRFRSSWLGFLWPVILPLLLIAVFSFVFGYVMPLRWTTDGEMERSFGVFLYSGLVVFTFFADVASRSPGLLLENTNLVKKVVFPLEVLPVVWVLTCLIFFVINLSVFLLVLLVTGESPSLTWLWLPLIALPLSLLFLGLSWFLSALTVYVRDVMQVIGVIISAGMFLSPIFYPLSAVPDPVQPWLAWSPLALAIESLRGAVFAGEAPSAGAMAALYAWGAVILFLGFAWFRRTKDGFADVL